MPLPRPCQAADNFRPTVRIRTSLGDCPKLDKLCRLSDFGQTRGVDRPKMDKSPNFVRVLTRPDAGTITCRSRPEEWIRDTHETTLAPTQYSAVRQGDPRCRQLPVRVPGYDRSENRSDCRALESTGSHRPLQLRAVHFRSGAAVAALASIRASSRHRPGTSRVDPLLAESRRPPASPDGTDGTRQNHTEHRRRPPRLLAVDDGFRSRRL